MVQIHPVTGSIIFNFPSLRKRFLWLQDGSGRNRFIAIKRRLLHPTPSVLGFTVGVFCVPVGLTIGATTPGVKLGTKVLKIIGWVAAGNAVGVDKVRGVFVGTAVGVKVSVAGGTIAVWV